MFRFFQNLPNKQAIYDASSDIYRGPFPADFEAHQREEHAAIAYVKPMKKEK